MSSLSHPSVRLAAGPIQCQQDPCAVVVAHTFGYRYGVRRFSASPVGARGFGPVAAAFERNHILNAIFKFFGVPHFLLVSSETESVRNGDREDMFVDDDFPKAAGG